MRTPGEWKYDTGPALKGRYHCVMAGEVMVAECYEGTEGEQEANAKLCADAPRLQSELDRKERIIGVLWDAYKRAAKCTNADVEILVRDL